MTHGVRLVNSLNMPRGKILYKDVGVNIDTIFIWIKLWLSDSRYAHRLILHSFYTDTWSLVMYCGGIPNVEDKEATHSEVLSG